MKKPLAQAVAVMFVALAAFAAVCRAQDKVAGQASASGCERPGIKGAADKYATSVSYEFKRSLSPMEIAAADREGAFMSDAHHPLVGADAPPLEAREDAVCSLGNPEIYEDATAEPADKYLHTDGRILSASMFLAGIVSGDSAAWKNDRDWQALRPYAASALGRMQPMAAANVMDLDAACKSLKGANTEGGETGLAAKRSYGILSCGERELAMNHSDGAAADEARLRKNAASLPTGLPSPDAN
jgi:hypothetical protein